MIHRNIAPGDIVKMKREFRTASLWDRKYEPGRLVEGGAERKPMGTMTGKHVALVLHFGILGNDAVVITSCGELGWIWSGYVERV